MKLCKQSTADAYLLCLNSNQSHCTVQAVSEQHLSAWRSGFVSPSPAADFRRLSTVNASESKGMVSILIINKRQAFANSFL